MCCGCAGETLTGKARVEAARSPAMRLDRPHKELMAPNFLHQCVGQFGTTLMWGGAVVGAAILATIFLSESNSGVRPPGVRRIPGTSRTER